MGTELHFLLIFILAAAVLVADYFVAREFYRAAVMKGHPDKKYFWICLLLTLAGYLLVAALPDRGGDALSYFVSGDLPEL